MSKNVPKTQRFLCFIPMLRLSRKTTQVTRQQTTKAITLDKPYGTPLNVYGTSHFQLLCPFL